MENKGEILLYQSEDGIVKIYVRLEGEPNEVSTCKNSLIVQLTS